MAFNLAKRSLLQFRKSFITQKQPNRNAGYIVLAPEIGEELSGKNPLLQHDGLPEFSDVTIEHCIAAIAKQTIEFETSIKKIEDELIEKPVVGNVFRELFDPLEELGAPLDYTWGLSKTLYLGNSTQMPTKSYLSIHNRAKKARAVKFNSPVIYGISCKELKSGRKKTDEEERLLGKFCLEGKLNGLDLSEFSRLKLNENLSKLNSNRLKFRQKVETATNRFVHTIKEPEVVRDFPVGLLKKLVPNEDRYLNGPWNVTLAPGVAKQFLEYCPDKKIRWNVWQATVSRGSSFNDKELETSINLEEIRFLRGDIAKLLGYNTFVDMSMETKMAGSKENVQAALQSLLEYAKPAQDLELQNLLKFAHERGFKDNSLELWDVPFWRRKQLKTLFEFDEEKYRNYFPLPKVLDGMLKLCEKLFNITIKRRNGVSTWHKDVQFFDVFEPNTSAPIAGFYLDPYVRSKEKIRIPNHNGWMVGIQNKSKILETKPLAALIFNFQPPTKTAPSLLTFEDVKSLFQKFGHSLQHLLTKATYSEVAGVSNIEWDAVEVCGHVLSHWLHKKSTIDLISGHFESGENLPDNLFKALVNANQHMAGLDLCKELYLSELDLEIYSTKDFWLNIVKRLWPVYNSFPLEKIDSHPCSFTAIFSEEWAAAYYSHVWSKMIAADVYSAFHEAADDEEEICRVGDRFKDTFLALGGSCHASQVFRKFRGRDPSPKALLRILGLKKPKSATSDSNK